MILLLAAACAAGALTARGGVTDPTLRSNGIGSVRFGATKAAAVAELGRLFGAQSARGINTGCSPRYTEVEWGDLIAEFRLNVFSGYRYAARGWPLTTPGSPRGGHVGLVRPRLVTARGISLGDSLDRARSAYGQLRLVGTDRWRAPDGLLLVDDAKPIAKPWSRHIAEIKIGTCGDF